MNAKSFVTKVGELKGERNMKTKIKRRLSLATCFSVSALVLCTSTPGWAANPYRQGQKTTGSHVNQHRGAANNRQIEANGRAEEARKLARLVEANRRAQEARRRAQQPEANRRAHLRDQQVQSNGKFVQHPDIPRDGVDQKGGVYDNVRREIPDVQRPVSTPRRNTNQQQKGFNIQPKREQPKQQLDKEAQRQARFAEFDKKYRAICARTNKPNCTPPAHPTTSGRGTSSYEESITGVM